MGDVKEMEPKTGDRPPNSAGAVMWAQVLDAWMAEICYRVGSRREFYRTR